MKDKRIPRKKKKTIPKDTDYCYTWSEKGKFLLCKFWYQNSLGWGDCKLFGGGNGENYLDLALHDQCKSCGLKEAKH